MKISKNILFRYESGIKGGKLFIFDLNRYKVYEGNYLEYLVLNGIKNNDMIQDIEKKIANTCQINNLEDKIRQFLVSLQKLGVLES